MSNVDIPGNITLKMTAPKFKKKATFQKNITKKN